MGGGADDEKGIGAEQEGVRWTTRGGWAKQGGMRRQ